MLDFSKPSDPRYIPVYAVQCTVLYIIIKFKKYFLLLFAPLTVESLATALNAKNFLSTPLLQTSPHAYG